MIEVREKLASQYSESEKFIGFIEALLAEDREIESSTEEVITLRALEYAEGAQLDVLGHIVGQPRTVVDASDLFYFGFSGAYHATGYGEARYASRGETTNAVRLLEDVEYRDFIKAKISRNHTTATAEAVVDLTKFLIGDPNTLVYVGELGGAKIKLTVGSIPDINRRILLLESGLFPKPAGVGIEFLYADGVPFAYNGSPGGAGFNVGTYATKTP